MLGSKNRDFKTSSRMMSASLDWHFQKMKSYMEQGLSKDEASKKALNDWNNLSKKEIKKVVENFKSKHW